LIVYALVGRSGSGKSHRAQSVSKYYGIEYIIDDGLLINGNRVLAGTSAKKEETRIAAIKRAIFNDANHRKQMIEALNAAGPQSILILGTSSGMVKRIAEVLELPPISMEINIEDVASPWEIETAIRTRREQGKHVIPVPTFAVKKDFSGYFMDSIRNFKKKDRMGDDMEKTVIGPTFSYLGKYSIADNVIKSMVSYAGEKVPGIHKILRVAVENKEKGLKLDMDVVVVYGEVIHDVIGRLKEYVRSEVEFMTAFNVLAINVYVKSLHASQ
jgi:uncharacterized alkaline shock family protein YloU/adenylate kinase family enzyme